LLFKDLGIDVNITTSGDNFPRFPPGRPADVPFDFEAWMKRIGRWPKDIIRRDKIKELPTPPDWKVIYDGFSYDSQQPFNDGAESRVVVKAQLITMDSLRKN
jgi:hypothetical protein